MRYTYLGDRQSSLRGIQCDPVLRPNGKCIRSRMGTMLVTDGNNQHIVLARLLRINKKNHETNHHNSLLYTSILM